MEKLERSSQVRFLSTMEKLERSSQVWDSSDGLRSWDLANRLLVEFFFIQCATEASAVAAHIRCTKSATPINSLKILWRWWKFYSDFDCLFAQTKLIQFQHISREENYLADFLNQTSSGSGGGEGNQDVNLEEEALSDVTKLKSMPLSSTLRIITEVEFVGIDIRPSLCYEEASEIRIVVKRAG
ncbi:hypothetical protein V6N13_115730 [Hibiscus sabdariffa]